MRINNETFEKIVKITNKLSKSPNKTSNFANEFQFLTNKSSNIAKHFPAKNPSKIHFCEILLIE
ncbi:hypothetical protein GCM10009865_18470 [Aeromicrobium ponti]